MRTTCEQCRCYGYHAPWCGAFCPLTKANDRAHEEVRKMLSAAPARVVVRRWTISIPRCIPSRNETAKQHWSARSRDKKLWAKDIGIAALVARVPAATGKRRLRIVRVMGKGQKRFDEDNHDIKALIDSLKPPKVARGTKAQPGCSLIIDDSPRYLDLVLPVVDERAEDGKPGTRLELEDCE